MIKEIEVKAILRNKDNFLIEAKKRDIVFEESKFQEDYVYANYEGLYSQFPPKTLFLRLRKVQDKVIFTVKQPKENLLSKIEKEIEVPDFDKMEEIIFLLGYKKRIEVKKKRRSADFGKYEICLDEVEDLGSFIEVEKMTDEEDDAVFEELFTFLESFGIKKEDRVFKGYDILMAEKMNI